MFFTWPSDSRTSNSALSVSLINISLEPCFTQRFAHSGLSGSIRPWATRPRVQASSTNQPRIVRLLSAARATGSMAAQQTVKVRIDFLSISPPLAGLLFSAVLVLIQDLVHSLRG